MPFNVAILGASGYTGAELVRIIATHPELRIAALSADRKAGMAMADVYPHLRHLDLPRLVQTSEIDFAGIDLVFCALPHGLSQALVRDLPQHLKIVDLGADFRLRDPAEYEKWYGAPHVATDLQQEAVYGLSEFYRDDIKSARLVAGTGCNAATVQFALRPLIEAGVIDLDEIICDLKNGISGAGRSLKENMLFAERSEDVAGYSQGGKHRHLSEFDQEFSAIAGRPVRIVFTPHLVPINRGILATIYLKGDAQAVYDALASRYADEPFIVVLPFGQLPAMSHVQGSNFCHIGVTADRISGRVLVVSTLDNLNKGSSGQAVQNANLMLGLDETMGLMLAPVFP
ncbi:N-acetyl-gamma-glutamyl-phosphate reductase [Ketogulonicigenium vulgare]|uniref:N-acetyl-gamma-glutamyl-phosphate reductase n=1 Tax=Ketogulonicigenium vulgare (strain WSH-001) TaxID=759362 RepID=F9YAH1_KETVW|nr:N-acetyl-gamma-glutamyl-phosphate reductase [Ketogulonicigenium vulgare]ADO43208.1 N-acetyl-gamma-glutamyl-phosphate reductase [Ketogulonicigenium vulgare Y25]AEM41502.1 N-acetyl-gamma-glutamyl-phosphate reductase [Ketogulonicigenium vulgare WSH-001]ALJ81628.1 N-acetyl-gamma-glutamyl-phosphate reductase [Ketogulonicigenium vulgare]ANW34305.1 N-acetyl-gamma-glutamyl-phosphate reductase [Ketogulonicigenium vulgare]AOZ55244.1 N-acetyl-gamma-glutamyl-phosphate reductase [Ketogulonicigenium vulg